MQKWTNEVRSERRHWINVTPLKDKKVLANNNIFIDFSNWKMSWCLHWQPPPLCHPPSAICIAIWSKTFSAICHYKPSRSTGKWRWDLFLLCRSKGFIYFLFPSLSTIWNCFPIFWSVDRALTPLVLLFGNFEHVNSHTFETFCRTYIQNC